MKVNTLFLSPSLPLVFPDTKRVIVVTLLFLMVAMVEVHQVVGLEKSQLITPVLLLTSMVMNMYRARLFHRLLIVQRWPEQQRVELTQ